MKRTCKVLARILIFTFCIVTIYLVVTNSTKIINAILSIPLSWAICYLLGCITACVACNWNHKHSKSESNDSDSQDDDSYENTSDSMMINLLNEENQG